jgi:GNAT superfamily N-acetyltransferase
MQFRLASEQDAESISMLNADVQKLHADALPHLFKQPTEATFPIATVIDLLNTPNHHFFMGEEEGKAVGYVYVEIQSVPESAIRYAATRVFIHHLSVQSQHQNKGYGGKLLWGVREWAKSKGITTMQLDFWSFNSGARAFYNKHGFTTFNERMWMEIE